jgi:hypothetical protein
MRPRRAVSPVIPQDDDELKAVETRVGDAAGIAVKHSQPGIWVRDNEGEFRGVSYQQLCGRVRLNRKETLLTLAFEDDECGDRQGTGGARGAEDAVPAGDAPPDASRVACRRSEAGRSDRRPARTLSLRQHWSIRGRLTAYKRPKRADGA